MDASRYHLLTAIKSEYPGRVLAQESREARLLLKVNSQLVKLREEDPPLSGYQHCNLDSFERRHDTVPLARDARLPLLASERR